MDFFSNVCFSRYLAWMRMFPRVCPNIIERRSIAVSRSTLATLESTASSSRSPSNGYERRHSAEFRSRQCTHRSNRCLLQCARTIVLVEFEFEVQSLCCWSATAFVTAWMSQCVSSRRHLTKVISGRRRAPSVRLREKRSLQSEIEKWWANLTWEIRENRCQSACRSP